MKILVVDDERDLGVLAGLLLRRRGHVPILALDPRDALHMLTPDVDAVITDIEMPGMSGVELARRIRELDPDIPIAFCTGSDPSEQTAMEAAELGIVHPKLSSLAQVEAVIQELQKTPEPAPAPSRSEKRHRARVSVSFGSAKEFVRQYTENLSRGGLFVRGAEDLALGQEVDVEIDLPGQGCFVVTAAVAFVLPWHEGEKRGRMPGVGLKIISAPPNYSEALECYLHRLERRRNFVVLAGDDQTRAALEDAGYSVMDVPPADELVATIARCEAPVVGVIVPRSAAPEYAAAASASGDPDLVRGIDYIEELDEHIAELDQVL